MENNISTVTVDAITVKARELPDHNRILQIDLVTGEIVGIHESPYRASEAVGYSCKRIKMVCRGTLKKAGGFFWCYENTGLQTQYNVHVGNYKQG